jgi:uncharacterized protein with PIN domain
MIHCLETYLDKLGYKSRCNYCNRPWRILAANLINLDDKEWIQRGWICAVCGKLYCGQTTIVTRGKKELTCWSFSHSVRVEGLDQFDSSRFQKEERVCVPCYHVLREFGYKNIGYIPEWKEKEKILSSVVNPRDSTLTFGQESSGDTCYLQEEES